MTAKTDLDKAIEVAEKEAELQRSNFAMEERDGARTLQLIRYSAKAETASLIAARLHALKETSK